MPNIKNEKNLNMEDLQENYYGVRAFLWEIIKVLFWAIIIIVPIRTFLLQPFSVQGNSMVPNFQDSDYLIVNEFGYKITDIKNLFKVDSFKEFKRQDVVVFKFPKNPSQFFIKRVIGLPGERIKIENSQVSIYNKENPDGFMLDERAYIPDNFRTNGVVDITLKNDEYFVMGDNREFSNDSRSWGPVRKDKVIGKVWVRAWPLNEIEIL